MAFLLVVFPAMLVLQARQLRAGARVSRRQMYVSSILSLWLLAIATVATASAGGYGADDLAIRPISWERLALWAAGATIIGEAVVLAGNMSGAQISDTLRDLLPVTRSDRALFVVVSATAGVCEEIMFRGFLIMTLTAATQSPVLGVTLAAVAFGVVHAYQDAAGVAVASLLALVLTVPVLITGSLYPSIVAHFAIDIIGGFWLGPALLRRHQAQRG